MKYLSGIKEHMGRMKWNITTISRVPDSLLIFHNLFYFLFWPYPTTYFLNLVQPFGLLKLSNTIRVYTHKREEMIDGRKVRNG